VLSASDFIQ